MQIIQIIFIFTLYIFEEFFFFGIDTFIISQKASNIQEARSLQHSSRIFVRRVDPPPPG